MSAPLCGAKCRDGHTCTNSPMHGSARCYMHGGASPQARLAAKRRLAQAAATKAIHRNGIAPVGDPIEGLRSLAAEAVQLKDYWAERLAALEEIRYTGQMGQEQLRSEAALFERSLDRAQKFLHDLAKLNLDERSVRLDEVRVAIFAGVVARALEKSDLPDEMVVTVRASIANELRLVEAG